MPASRVQGTLLQRDVQKLFGITITVLRQNREKTNLRFRAAPGSLSGSSSRRQPPHRSGQRRRQRVVPPVIPGLHFRVEGQLLEKPLGGFPERPQGDALVQPRCLALLSDENGGGRILQ